MYSKTNKTNKQTKQTSKLCQHSMRSIRLRVWNDVHQEKLHQDLEELDEEVQVPHPRATATEGMLVCSFVRFFVSSSAKSSMEHRLSSISPKPSSPLCPERHRPQQVEGHEARVAQLSNALAVPRRLREQRETDRQASKQTKKQTSKQTNNQTNKQSNKQTKTKQKHAWK